MANTLILNQPQVWNGTGTLTFTIPATAQYNVKVQTTFPFYPAVNAGASNGLARAASDGIIGAGSGMGLGSGTGGGGEGFTGGDLGVGHGGVGQGFGAGNSYQQPSAQPSNAIPSSPQESTLSIVVNKNGSPIYTSTAPTIGQSGLQFQTNFLATLNDTITVVLSSAASVDNQLSGITSNVSIGQGF